jgi:predicted tellurium resistance membrane protein TerC
MGGAADFLAQVLHRVRWIAWLGLAVVVYVAVGMVISGWPEVAPYF